ncbi:uncharacterized protein LOC135837283 isoform X2 [Planococcus citri]
MNKTIFKLFQSVKTVVVSNLLRRIQNLEPNTYEYNLSRPIEGFQDRIIFCDVTIQDIWLYKRSKHIDYDFLNNKIKIELDETDIHFGADVYSARDTYYGSFYAVMEIKHGCLINVAKLPGNDLDKVFQIDMEFSNSSNITYNIFNESVTRNSDLVKEIESKLPSILLDNMKNNQIFLQSLNNSYGFHPKRHLLAQRRGYMNREQLYNYRIPTAPHFCFKLINITIRGMSNFHSLKFHQFPKTYVHTLLIKDIRGNVILDYGRESEPYLKFNFHADYLSISKDRFTERYGIGLKVGAHWCTVNTAEGNIPVTSIQSEGIVRSIESAIAFSFMPRFNVWKAHEIDDPMEQKCSEISSELDWNKTKELCKKWIPFNEDYSQFITEDTIATKIFKRNVARKIANNSTRTYIKNKTKIQNYL